MTLPHPPGFEVRVGVDVVDIERIEQLVARYPRAAQRLFTPDEIAYCSARARPYEHMAGRVAAKEAVFKAFGTGWARGVRWVDVEVVRAEDGRPAVRLDGVLADRAWAPVDLDVSISHTASLATACAIGLWRAGALAPKGQR